MPPTVKGPTRVFQYRLKPGALQLFLDLSPRFGQLRDGAWVVNCQEIARQGGILPNSLTELNRGNIALSEKTMSALVGVAIANGMDRATAEAALFDLVDARGRRGRRSLRAVAA